MVKERLMIVILDQGSKVMGKVLITISVLSEIAQNL